MPIVCREFLVLEFDGEAVVWVTVQISLCWHCCTGNGAWGCERSTWYSLEKRHLTAVSSVGAPQPPGWGTPGSRLGYQILGWRHSQVVSRYFCPSGAGPWQVANILSTLWYPNHVTLKLQHDLMALQKMKPWPLEPISDPVTISCVTRATSLHCPQVKQ